MMLLRLSRGRHSWAHTLGTLEATLGKDALNYFDDIDQNAIASGSIAQVRGASHLDTSLALHFIHLSRCRLPYGCLISRVPQVHVAHLEGHKVAVKVRHPGVRRQIALDFHIMKSVARFVHYIPGMSWLNLEASMEQFSDTIAGQTRLDVEGDNLDNFVHNFKAQRQWCGFPRVILKSHALLVESFEEGQLASKYVTPFRRYRDFLRRRDAAAGSAPKAAGIWSRVCGVVTCCFGASREEEEWNEDEYVDLSLGQVC